MVRGCVIWPGPRCGCRLGRSSPRRAAAMFWSRRHWTRTSPRCWRLAFPGVRVVVPDRPVPILVLHAAALLAALRLADSADGGVPGAAYAA
jgi:hypothetical protein